MSITRFVQFASVLSLLALAPLRAQAGAWPINCDDEKAKVSFTAEHYKPTKAGDYSVVPPEVSITVDGKSEAKGSVKKVGSVLVVVFKAYTVVYSGTATAEQAKTATVYDKDGNLITTAKCQLP